MKVNGRNIAVNTESNLRVAVSLNEDKVAWVVVMLPRKTSWCEVESVK